MVIISVIFLIAAVIALIIGICLAVDVAQGDPVPQIPFKSFLRFYEMNPKRWELNRTYAAIRPHSQQDGDKIYYSGWQAVEFSLLGKLQYRIFYRKQKKREQKERTIRETAKIIDCVKQDITAYEERAKREQDHALEQILKSMEKEENK